MKYLLRSTAVLATILLAMIPAEVGAGYFSKPVTSGTITSLIDHTQPTYASNNNFTRHDGAVFTGNVDKLNCSQGTNCYDGHNGVDYGVPQGTNVYAAADGVVSQLETISGYGYIVRIWHSGINMTTLYAHLSTNMEPANVYAGASVVQGQLIGLSGKTGCGSCGPHLHFSVFAGNTILSANTIDPYGWTGSGTDPWTLDQGYLWTGTPPPVVPPTPTPPPYVSWNFENLDGDNGAVGGHETDNGYTPGVIAFNSGLHSFYVDKTDGDLRHAWDSGGGWQFEVLDGSGGASGRIAADAGYRPTTVIYQGNLHVFYYDNTNHGLRQAWTSNGTSWNLRTLDGSASTVSGHTSADVGFSSSAMVSSGGSLQLFYYDSTYGNLRHAWHNATDWHFENLDGDPGSVGGFNANLGKDPVSILYGTGIQLFYYDASNGNLRHAWDNGGGWNFETMDGTSGTYGNVNGDVGLNPEAVSFSSTLQLFYYDATNGNLRHGWSDSGGWHFENLEGDAGSVSGYNSNTGLTPSATVLGSGLQLFTYEAASAGGNVRHAWSDSGGWHFENLDGAGGEPAGRISANVGEDVRAITYGGKVHLFYYDATYGNFRHSWNM